MACCSEIGKSISELYPRIFRAFYQWLIESSDQKLWVKHSWFFLLIRCTEQWNQQPHNVFAVSIIVFFNIIVFFPNTSKQFTTKQVTVLSWESHDKHKNVSYWSTPTTLTTQHKSEILAFTIILSSQNSVKMRSEFAASLEGKGYMSYGWGTQVLIEHSRHNNFYDAN